MTWDSISHPVFSNRIFSLSRPAAGILAERVRHCSSCTDGHRFAYFAFIQHFSSQTGTEVEYKVFKYFQPDIVFPCRFNHSSHWERLSAIGFWTDTCFFTYTPGQPFRSANDAGPVFPAASTVLSSVLRYSSGILSLFHAGRQMLRPFFIHVKYAIKLGIGIVFIPLCMQCGNPSAPDQAPTLFFRLHKACKIPLPVYMRIFLHITARSSHLFYRSHKKRASAHHKSAPAHPPSESLPPLYG